jgi:glycosyltransferase involved in cell wall biosynthesis
LLPEEDLVERNDPQGLAERIVEIVSNPQRMSMTSSRNLKRARDYHHRILTARRSAFYQLLRTCTESWIGKRMSA